MNAQHLSLSDSWMTPQDIIDRTTRTLGGIDIDPASCEAANERVKADHWYDEKADGLAVEWTIPPWLRRPKGDYAPQAAVFCNPPGGKYPKGHALGGQGKTGLFWQKLMTERAVGHIKHAVFLFFSIEALSNLQGNDFYSPTQFPVCIPDHRIAYDPPPGVKASQPTHANAIVYVPGTVDDTQAFMAQFAPLGHILKRIA